MKKLVSALVSLDQRIVLRLVPQRRQHLDRWIRWITFFGDGWIWLFLAFGIALVDPNPREIIIQMGAAFALELSIYKLLKEACSRKRPFDLFKSVRCIVHPSDRYSFPSGHTAAAFVVLATAGIYYELLFVPLLLLAFLIGFSRVYAGVHYPSDVIAGALLGTTCAAYVRAML